MKISISCQDCGKRFEVPGEYGGKRAKCNSCGNMIQIPVQRVLPPEPPNTQLPNSNHSHRDIAPPAPSSFADSQLVRSGEPTAPECATGRASGDNWYVRTSSGNTYGPVCQRELDGWIAESRIDRTSHVMREGESSWQHAADVFPSLRVSDTIPNPARFDQTFTPKQNVTAAVYIPQPERVSVAAAGLLNWLFQGAGYFVVGQSAKGTLVCFITLVLFVMDFVTCGLGLLLHLPYMIVCIIDVVLIAQRINRGEHVGEWACF